jgi:hypothetical protein
MGLVDQSGSRDGGSPPSLPGRGSCQGGQPPADGGLLVGVCLRRPGEARAGRGAESRRAWT